MFGNMSMNTHARERGCTCKHTHTRARARKLQAHTHISVEEYNAHICTAHKLNTTARTPLLFHAPAPAVLPPDLPQLQDVKHGLKDPHADGAAAPWGSFCPCRRRRGRGRANRGGIRGVTHRRAPTAVLGA